MDETPPLCGVAGDDATADAAFGGQTFTATSVPRHVAACTVANPPLPRTGPISSSDASAKTACHPALCKCGTGSTTPARWLDAAVALAFIKCWCRR